MDGRGNRFGGGNVEVGAIAGVATALSGAQFKAEFAAAALSAQLEIVQDAGENALHLIRAASLDPSTGQSIDLRI